jgi:hypothetical protein
MYDARYGTTTYHPIKIWFCLMDGVGGMEWDGMEWNGAFVLLMLGPRFGRSEKICWCTVCEAC